MCADGQRHNPKPTNSNRSLGRSALTGGTPEIRADQRDARSSPQPRSGMTRSQTRTWATTRLTCADAPLERDLAL